MEKCDFSGINLEVNGKCSDCGDGMYLAEGNKGDAICHDCEVKRSVSNEQQKIGNVVNGFFNNVRSSEKYRTNSNVPKRYLHSSLDNFIGEERDAIPQWLEGENQNLLIQSPKAGNGKTHLAVASMVEYVASKRDACMEHNVDNKRSRFKDNFGNINYRFPTAKIVNFSELMLEIKSSFDSVDKSEQDVIQEYCNYDILVIDDIGAEKASDYTQTVIYTILNRRYEDIRATIITTNLSSANIANTYGGRILSRIASGVVITLSGIDRRLKRG